MRNLSFSALLLGAAALVAGCEGSGSVLEVASTGAVSGGVYRDLNGNGVADSPTDQPFRNVEVRLVSPGSGAVVARATTDTTGSYTIRDVPVGRYRMRAYLVEDGARTPLRLVTQDAARTLQQEITMMFDGFTECGHSGTFPVTNIGIAGPE